ncbi:hypothetical protein F7725_024014 [Dissostichus mawsoni]|uniref:Uncharacterized protein n=1 Tax=Dissostichus mawsoni TaxID=36200 RepID=A0A7J5XZ16_DISMA|nr:hypothetical protein F7725_024014 [Dissostichus mawsoni]
MSYFIDDPLDQVELSLQRRVQQQSQRVELHSHAVIDAFRAKLAQGGLLVEEFLNVGPRRTLGFSDGAAFLQRPGGVVELLPQGFQVAIVLVPVGLGGAEGPGGALRFGLGDLRWTGTHVVGSVVVDLRFKGRGAAVHTLCGLRLLTWAGLALRVVGREGCRAVWVGWFYEQLVPHWAPGHGGRLDVRADRRHTRRT